MAVQETYVALTATAGRDFRQEAAEVLHLLQGRLTGRQPVWLRFHLSDVTNQQPILDGLLAEADWLPPDVLRAPVGQAPANGARIALEGYLVGEDTPVERRPGMTLLRLANYTVVCLSAPTLHSQGSGPQMREEFAAVERALAPLGGTLAAHVQRTWIYCRDIDNNYAALVVARRELFAERGLTADTHYIASTGIEGSAAEPSRLVRMDTLALLGHDPAQIQYLQAPDHLSPTHVYGVTFERGTRIVYGDRSHLFISGTASIDRDGHIVHPGDVRAQTERLLDNVEALLADGAARLEHLVQAVVYLRDPADAATVEEVLSRRLSPSTARRMVRGSVCRPGWLVEMDAIAVTPDGHPSFRDFC